MNQLAPSANGQPRRNGGKSLEPHSRSNDVPDSKATLEGQLRECFGRVVYSHKTHEKCADILLSQLSQIKLWQIILSAVTTGGCIAILFGAGKAGLLISVIVSMSLLALNM